MQNESIEFEILVVDDNPKVLTPPLADQIDSQFHDPRIRYVQNSVNLGCFGNMNKCISLAKHEYLVMLHDDDKLLPHHLETIKYSIENHPEIDLIFAEQDIFINGKKIERTGFGKINDLLKTYLNISNTPVRLRPQDFFLHNVVVGPTGVVFRKSKAQLLGGFNDAYYPIDDYKFWSDFSANYTAYMLPQVLSIYRQENNITLSEGIYPKIFHMSHRIQNQLFLEGIVQSPFARAYLYEATKLRLASLANKTEKPVELDQVYLQIFGEKYQHNLVRSVFAKVYLLYAGTLWAFRVLKAHFLKK